MIWVHEQHINCVILFTHAFHSNSISIKKHTFYGLKCSHLFNKSVCMRTSCLCLRVNKSERERQYLGMRGGELHSCRWVIAVNEYLPMITLYPDRMKSSVFFLVFPLLSRFQRSSFYKSVLWAWSILPRFSLEQDEWSLDWWDTQFHSTVV